jgi:hypothetical protein
VAGSAAERNSQATTLLCCCGSALVVACVAPGRPVATHSGTHCCLPLFSACPVQALPGWLRQGKTNTESPSPPKPPSPLSCSRHNPQIEIQYGPLSSSAAAAQEVMYLRLGQICDTGSDVDGRSRGLTAHNRWGGGSSGGRRGGASCGHGPLVGMAAAGLLARLGVFCGE